MSKPARLRKCDAHETLEKQLTITVKELIIIKGDIKKMNTETQLRKLQLVELEILKNVRIMG